MFKEKVIKGLICLGVIGVLASSSWAVGKKPAQEQARVKKVQDKAQAETEKKSGKGTEQKGTQVVEAKGTSTVQEGQKGALAGGYVRKEILFIPWGKGKSEIGLKEVTKWATGASIRGTVTRRYGPSKIEVDKDGNIFIFDEINQKIQRYSREGRRLSSVSLNETKKESLLIERFKNNCRYEFIKKKEPTPFAYKRYDEKEWTVGIRILDVSNNVLGEIIYEDPHISTARPVVGMDKEGNIYLLVDTTEAVCAGPEDWRVEIHKYSKEGNLLAKIKLSKDIDWTERDEGQKDRITVDKNGSIYQLLPKEDGIHILKWEVK